MNNTTKVCKYCGVPITPENAYRYSGRTGLMNICKKCLVIQNRINRHKNPEKYRLYFRKYHYRRPLAKKRARYAVKDALIDGKIQRKPCAICDRLPTEAHHPDYSKPLEIIWLCKKHHRKNH